MDGSPFIIYVIIMIIVGIFNNYQKKQKELARKQRQNSDEPPVLSEIPSMAKGSKLARSGQRPTLHSPGRIVKPKLPESLQTLSETTKPVQKHPLDLQQAYENQATFDPYIEGLAEIPAIESVSTELSQIVNENEDAQKFWNEYDGVKRVEPMTSECKSALINQLTPKLIAQGIILSEILQPPRAKRPYCPIYQERKK